MECRVKGKLIIIFSVVFLVSMNKAWAFGCSTEIVWSDESNVEKVTLGRETRLIDENVAIVFMDYRRFDGVYESELTFFSGGGDLKIGKAELKYLFEGRELAPSSIIIQRYVYCSKQPCPSSKEVIEDSRDLAELHVGGNERLTVVYHYDFDHRTKKFDRGKINVSVEYGIDGYKDKIVRRSIEVEKHVIKYNCLW